MSNFFGQRDKDGYYYKNCQTCGCDFKTLRRSQKRCYVCIDSPKSPIINECEICGGAFTKKYVHPDTLQRHRLCLNHYAIVKRGVKTIEQLKEDIKNNVKDNIEPIPLKYLKNCVLCGEEYETNSAYSKICEKCGTRKKTKIQQKCEICEFDGIAFKYSDGYAVHYLCPTHHYLVSHHKIGLNGSILEPAK